MAMVELTMVSGKKWRSAYMDDATINPKVLVTVKGWHLFEVGPMQWVWLNMAQCESVQMVTDRWDSASL